MGTVVEFVSARITVAPMVSRSNRGPSADFPPHLHRHLTDLLILTSVPRVLDEAEPAAADQPRH